MVQVEAGSLHQLLGRGRLVLNKVGVDVWFVFGSFVYGFEGRVMDCGSEHMEVQLCLSDFDGAQGVVSFLEEIATGAKSLLKSQISIFDNSAPHNAESPLRVFTEISPAIKSQTPAGRLVFSGLRGVTEQEHALWQKLVAGQWPHF